MVRGVVRTAVRVLAGIIVALLTVALILVGIVSGLIETRWGRDRLRELVVREANRYLTATLTIGRLDGTLLGGIRLGEVRLVRDRAILASVDEIEVTYKLRELFRSATVIRHVRLTRPRFALTRQADGRWDLAAIVRRDRPEGAQTGGFAHPMEVQAIEIQDGAVQLRAPLDFGAVHAPTDFESLNAALSFAYAPGSWRLSFGRISWVGRAPDLSVSRLTGTFGNGTGGWFFDALSVETARSAFTVNGRVVRSHGPTELHLTVRAARFAFQEWSGVLRGLRNIAVDASFDTVLEGPVSKLATDLQLKGTGGGIKGRLTIDTTVPGWHGAGVVDVTGLNLARWLNNADRPSDITGRVSFDLALELGRHFPRGVYTFDGPHAMFMNYAADAVKARGQVTATSALVAEATATAYGAAVGTHDGSIGIESPFPFRFQGNVAGIDLRQLPSTVPVPRVESVLTFDYDVSGRFARPFIAGRATFAPSTFLGASVGAGTIGTIDTGQTPLRFSGDGDLADVDLGRFGEGLQVGWLQDPRYAGMMAGHFRVEGQGTDRSTLTLTGSGRLERGDFFNGRLADAKVSIDIERGTLRARYAGGFAKIDPAVPFAETRLQAIVTGTGDVAVTVHDLFVRDPTLADYELTGSLALQPSSIRGIAIDRASVTATLRASQLSLTALEVSGLALAGRASGTIALDDRQPSAFDYDVARADLARLQPVTGGNQSGVVSTKGQLTGSWSALRAVGDAAVADPNAFSMAAQALTGHYDVVVPSGDLRHAMGRVDVRGTSLTVLDRPVQEVSGSVTIDGQRVGVDLHIVQSGARSGTIVGAIRTRFDARAVDIQDLTIGIGHESWRLQPADPAVSLQWDEAGISITPATLSAGNGNERVGVSGSWRKDGAGALRVTASHVSLDELQTAIGQPARYGGVLDLDATIQGTRDLPLLASTITVADGRVEQIHYQVLTGRVEYANRTFTIDLRLDQAPGASIAATGTVPLAVIDPDLPEQPINVSITSSAISLGLIEGFTAAVREVSGQVTLNIQAVGTSRDPHFTGAISITGAAFAVPASGVNYSNGRLGVALASDRIAVNEFRLEDSNHRSLEVHGAIGTHELRVGDLEIDISARRFEVLRNQFGRMDVDANVRLSGRSESPQLTGDVSISAGDLQVDAIFERMLFQPYASEETPLSNAEGAAALSAWDRLGLNIGLHVRNTLRLVGDNVQLSPGTPIGLGDIKLRVAGDLNLYKDPHQTMSVTGSLDSVTGTYAFQGRRFDVDPSSSIVFHGESSPELYIGVTRTISGVQTRVDVTGPMKQPELRLSSVPPLDQSDILSLIVFNASTSDLSGSQQQELAVRAGALAAGFLATPLMSAISRDIGLDILAIDPGSELAGGAGARVTVGQEITPGLVARFSRLFGPEPYDQATVEYYLSRIIRLRATFSDAQSLAVRSPFRNIDRAGIDVLFFFSF